MNTENISNPYDTKDGAFTHPQMEIGEHHEPRKDHLHQLKMPNIEVSPAFRLNQAIDVQREGSGAYIEIGEHHEPRKDHLNHLRMPNIEVSPAFRLNQAIDVQREGSGAYMEIGEHHEPRKDHLHHLKMKAGGVVWFRRVLRLYDNKIVEKAAEKYESLQFVFVFDYSILKRFTNPFDRRISFIINSLEIIDRKLKKLGGNLHILFGEPTDVIPEFVMNNNILEVFTETDFEESSNLRDEIVAKKISDQAKFTRVLDHLLIHPKEILKDDGTPFKVYTPYMKSFRSKIKNYMLTKAEYKISVKQEESIVFDKIEIAKKAGFEYVNDEIWNPEKADEVLESFIKNKLSTYHETRNLLSIEGSSKISPYLRFGIISIRDLYRKCLDLESHPSFVNELIWREFYAYIMFHFPESINSEFQTKYRDKIKWKYNEKNFKAFCEGKTGYPVIDAAIRELLSTGWMHNRARMIVASFFTKNLFMDWRLGEEFFAQHLMDYELASNVGGWQWTASTGTDAQPYFRVFNPINQGRDFDKDGSYVRTYVPELAQIPLEDLHDHEAIFKKYKTNYPAPIIDYKSSREHAIASFKEIS